MSEFANRLAPHANSKSQSNDIFTKFLKAAETINLTATLISAALVKENQSFQSQILALEAKLNKEKDNSISLESRLAAEVALKNAIEGKYKMTIHQLAEEKQRRRAAEDKVRSKHLALQEINDQLMKELER